MGELMDAQIAQIALLCGLCAQHTQHPIGVCGLCVSLCVKKWQELNDSLANCNLAAPVSSYDLGDDK